MKKSGSHWGAALALASGMLAVGSANADWTFGSGTTVPADGTGISVTNITGAYAANGGTLSSSGSAINTGSTYGINGLASAGTAWAVDSTSAPVLYSGGGLGMSSDSTGGTAPNHALDNGPRTNSSDLVSGLGNTESLLLSFSNSVVLSSIGLGYKAGDADISLFRYNGTSAPTVNSTGASLSSMTTAGWELVGNYADLVQDTTSPFNMVNGCTNPSGTTVTCATSSKGSSWWLISAYNTAYGAGTNLSQGNDYFKLYAVAGTACTSQVSGICRPPSNQTPEPASLALASLALLGAVGAGRRRNRSKAVS